MIDEVERKSNASANGTTGTRRISPRAQKHRTEMRLHSPRLRDLVCLFQGGSTTVQLGLAC